MSISDPALPLYLPSNCEKPPFPGLSLHRSPAAEDRRMTRPLHHAGRALPGESDCSQGNRQMLSTVGGLLQQILLGTVLSWLPLPNGPKGPLVLLRAAGRGKALCCNTDVRDKVWFS